MMIHAFQTIQTHRQTTPYISVGKLWKRLFKRLPWLYTLYDACKVFFFIILLKIYFFWWFHDIGNQHKYIYIIIDPLFVCDSHWIVWNYWYMLNPGWTYIYVQSHWPKMIHTKLTNWWCRTAVINGWSGKIYFDCVFLRK